MGFWRGIGWHVGCSLSLYYHTCLSHGTTTGPAVKRSSSPTFQSWNRFKPTGSSALLDCSDSRSICISFLESFSSPSDSADAFKFSPPSPAVGLSASCQRTLTTRTGSGEDLADDEIVRSGVKIHTFIAIDSGASEPLRTRNFRTPWLSMEVSKRQASHFSAAYACGSEATCVETARWSFRSLRPDVDGSIRPMGLLQSAHKIVSSLLILEEVLEVCNKNANQRKVQW